MGNLREIRDRMKSVTSTQQITKAMKMVSAAKLKKAQDNIWMMRPYFSKLNQLLENLTAGLEIPVTTPLHQSRELNNVLIVLITSDRGLCGAFNSNIIKRVSRLIHEKYSEHFQNGKLHLICLGKKGYEHFLKRKFTIDMGYTDFFTGISYQKCMKISQTVVDGFISGKYDVVEMVYNEFKNVATQIQKAEVLLPISPEKTGDKKPTLKKTSYLTEPTPEHLVKELIPKMLKVKFYKAILESVASEQGARMTAMSQATDNAQELLKNLRLVYNRERQAKITKEIIEIVSGAEALSAG
ncbi:MAG: ATP synthase F1 subunit gamma [Bacteroidetes bacterium RIFCSPLOWO2_02_FULL_36_8]|nr:MAG: ATP synthase F1 subunit gamma [Bacteroidetes bacterium RIFCSPLOWO2_02_FULL_36_8]OFY71204.1 MAG: ATP synthase F1 subunit gamma [Bacteroidetes bacterium RIFCSPLOWO2_12_FULL_37_12]